MAFFLVASVWIPNGAAQSTTFEDNPAVALSNDKLDLTLMLKGSTLASIVLKDDPEKLSPLWNPMRMARELGRQPHFDGGAGVFVCVDGFGPVSAEEKAAGLPGHGEAHSQMFAVESRREGKSSFVSMRANLPIVHETFTRTFKILDGENVVLVESELENQLGFDRPVNWAEHATIGSPFLASGETVVDISGSRSRTRPYDQPNNGQSARRLAPSKDFTWPLAPGLHGESIDLRETPENAHYLDHAHYAHGSESRTRMGHGDQYEERAPARLPFPAGGISMAPVLGQLSIDRKILTRHGIRHTAFRCAAAGGH